MPQLEPTSGWGKSQPLSDRRREAWLSYLHSVRACEIELIFGELSPNIFGAVLELGAGDGYQSRLLAKYTRQVISTEYDEPPNVGDVPNVVARACDAEKIAETFADERFELVFSSNMLEHISDPQAVLHGVARVLAPGGVTIHVIPNPLWKLCHVGLHIPGSLLAVARLARGKDGIRTAVNTIRQRPQRDRTDNPKLPRRQRSLLRQILNPGPHGASPTNRAEVLAFRRSRWLMEFDRAGLEMIDVLKGPFSSGYGLTTVPIRRLAERLGLHTTTVYIARASV